MRSTRAATVRRAVVTRPSGRSSVAASSTTPLDRSLCILRPHYRRPYGGWARATALTTLARGNAQVNMLRARARVAACARPMPTSARSCRAGWRSSPRRATKRCVRRSLAAGALRFRPTDVSSRSASSRRPILRRSRISRATATSPPRSASPRPTAASRSRAPCANWESRPRAIWLVQRSISQPSSPRRSRSGFRPRSAVGSASIPSSPRRLRSATSTTRLPAPRPGPPL